MAKMRWVLGLALAGCLQIVTSAGAQPAAEGGKKEIAIASPRTFAQVASGVFWRQPINEPGSRFLRVHFSDIIDASATGYRIVVMDYRDQVVFEYAKADFGSRRDFWSGIVDGDRITVEIRSDAAPVGLSFKLREYVFQQPRATFESITGRNDLTPVIKLGTSSAIYKAAGAVAKLSFVAADGPATCTGFLVRDSLLVTNEHCVRTQDECNTAVATFGYQEDASGAVTAGERVACRKWIKSIYGLDVSVLQLDGTPAQRWGRLEFAPRALVQDEALIIIQHPSGQPKQVSQVDCKVSTPQAPGREDTSDFGHLCDTMGGSSGSPVLDSSLKVVGLHHFGFTTDRWSKENRAVRIQLIEPALRDVLP